ISLFQVSSESRRVDQDAAKVALELRKLRKLAADYLVQDSSKLPSTHQPDAFLNTRINAVVLLGVQSQRVQCLLGDANLPSDPHNCRPVNDRHRAYESACGDRHKQPAHDRQRENSEFPTALSHRCPYASSKMAL